MSKKEVNKRLSFNDIEVRSILDEISGKRYLEGLIPYNQKSIPMWGSTCEIVGKTAFKKTLNDGANVFALINHDGAKILGSSKSGTLTLTNTDEGLRCNVEIPDTTYANDLYNIMERGDVKTMSFGFQKVKYQDDLVNNTCTIKECVLREVSFGVYKPCYPTTESATYTRGFEMKNIDIDGLNGILERSDDLSDEEKLIVNDVIDILKDIISPKGDTVEPVVETTPTGIEPVVETTHEGESGTARNDDDDLEKVRLMIEAELAI